MNEVKFNSQICTTIEQSKRLLELGLKPETADCFHWNYAGVNYVGNITEELEPTDVPAWSLHRLMEIGNIENVGFADIKNVYDTCISMIASHIKFGLLNKEYLKQ